MTCFCLNKLPYYVSDFVVIISSICQNTTAINIIRQKYSKEKMQGRVLEINEVRCNFCFNWITGNHLVKKGINSCVDCITRYLNQSVPVHTPSGTTYQILLKKDSKRFDPQGFIECRSLHQDDKTDQHQAATKRSNQPIIAKLDTEKSSEEPFFDVKLSLIPKKGEGKVEHVMDFVRAFNIATSKSVLLERDSRGGIKPHQSLIFNTPERIKEQGQFLSLKKIGKLEDYGRSLDRTRFLQRYQYYYDANTIEEFIEQHPKIEERSQRSKQFGRQLLGNDFDQSRSVRSKVSKSFKSKISNDSMMRAEKLNEEQLKTKISCFLESKYHSESLTRIMATYLKEAYENTSLQNKTLELINYKISSIDLLCYLKMFNFDQICIVKLINAGLTDEQIPILVNFIWNKPVESLVLTGNKLTQNCLSVFLNKSLPNLKQLYLGNNRISKTKLKQNIAQLHSKFILYL